MTKIVLDTNVFVSGIFWPGQPRVLLIACQDRKIKLVANTDILDEYIRVAENLTRKYKGVDIAPFVNLALLEADLIPSSSLKEPVSRDPDDDKFIACALSANCKIIVSGDQDLLSVSGYAGIEVLKPAVFVEKYL